MFWSGFIGMKFLVAVAVLFGLSWLVCSNLIGSDQLYYDQQRRATEDYLKRAIPKIVDKWDYEALRQRTTPELHVSESWKRMPEKFRIYKKELGQVTEYQEMLGSIELDASTGEARRAQVCPIEADAPQIRPDEPRDGELDADEQGALDTHVG